MAVHNLTRSGTKFILIVDAKKVELLEYSIANSCSDEFATSLMECCTSPFQVLKKLLASAFHFVTVNLD